MSWVKKHPILLSVIALNAILMIILLVVFLSQNAKTALVDVLVTPTDSKITLNGQEVKNFETQKLKPGQYMAKIEKEGMETKEISLNLEKDTTTKLHTYLTGNDNDFSYYISHGDAREALKNFNNDQGDVQKFFQKYNKITSIKDILPIYKTDYNGQELVKDIKIAQTKFSDCPTYVCFLITSIFPVNQPEIDNIIKEKGYEPTNYQYEYKIY